MEEFDSNIVVDLTNDDENMQEYEIIEVETNYNTQLVNTTDLLQVSKTVTQPSSSSIDQIDDIEDLIIYKVPIQYRPENMIGATVAQGEIMFLIKWKNTNKVNLVPKRIVNDRWPQIVIKFYEKRLQFH